MIKLVLYSNYYNMSRNLEWIHNERNEEWRSNPKSDVPVGGVFERRGEVLQGRMLVLVLEVRSGRDVGGGRRQRLRVPVERGAQGGGRGGPAPLGGSAGRGFCVRCDCQQNKNPNYTLKKLFNKKLKRW